MARAVRFFTEAIGGRGLTVVAHLGFKPFGDEPMFGGPLLKGGGPLWGN